MPATWSSASPVDIIGVAPPERYGDAMPALLSEPGCYAILALHCPTALASSSEAADAVAATARRGVEVTAQ
ncbi:MAG: hypothetical protein HEQ16_17560 [Bosea sp.]|nr:hypothetical protein [Bosea sp. (in: a-proteobacteria)]